MGGTTYDQVPKSLKLQRELGVAECQNNIAQVEQSLEQPVTEPVIELARIKEVLCCNDFVAILQYEKPIAAGLELPDGSKHIPEGLVVGVGPGVSDGAGGRLKLAVNIGDEVLFQEKSIITKIDSRSPPYNGARIVLLSERNILCILGQREFEWF